MDLFVGVILGYMAMTTPTYPDLIGRVDGLNNVIAEPLSLDDQQTVIEGMWKRELRDLEISIERHDANPSGWMVRTFLYPQPAQNSALFHLLQDHGSLRAGDFVVLHGTLLSALQPNTYALAKRWQPLMKCVGDERTRDPSCQDQGY
jgi:hypothetical protein